MSIEVQGSIGRTAAIAPVKTGITETGHSSFTGAKTFSSGRIEGNSFNLGRGSIGRIREGAISMPKIETRPRISVGRGSFATVRTENPFVRTEHPQPTVMKGGEAMRYNFGKNSFVRLKSYPTPTEVVRTEVARPAIATKTIQPETKINLGKSVAKIRFNTIDSVIIGSNDFSRSNRGPQVVAKASQGELDRVRPRIDSRITARPQLQAKEIFAAPKLRISSAPRNTDRVIRNFDLANSHVITRNEKVPTKTVLFVSPETRVTPAKTTYTVKSYGTQPNKVEGTASEPMKLRIGKMEAARQRMQQPLTRERLADLKISARNLQQSKSELTPAVSVQTENVRKAQLLNQIDAKSRQVTAENRQAVNASVAKTETVNQTQSPITQLETRLQQLRAEKQLGIVSAPKVETKPQIATATAATVAPHEAAIARVQAQILQLKQQPQIAFNEVPSADCNSMPVKQVDIEKQKVEKMKALQHMKTLALQKKDVKKQTEKVEQKNIEQKQPVYFVRDIVADMNRTFILSDVISRLAQQQSGSSKNYIQGAEIALHVPVTSLPPQIVSEFRLHVAADGKKAPDKDGTFQQIRKYFIRTGRIPLNETNQHIQNAIELNPAVRQTSKIEGEEVLHPDHAVRALNDKIAQVSPKTRIVGFIQKEVEHLKTSKINNGSVRLAA